MKWYKLVQLLLAIVFFGCDEPDADNGLQGNDSLSQTNIKLTDVADPALLQHTTKYSLCDTSLRPQINDPDLKASFDLRDRETFLKEFQLLKEHKDLKLIKGLGLSNVDSIPIELAEFDQVEELYVYRGKNLKGIDKFVGLKMVYLFWYEGPLPIEMMNDRLEIFKAEKSILTGFKQLSKVKNLKELIVVASDIDSLPNVNGMSGLIRFNLSVYDGATIDLEKLDLTSNKCLSYLTILSRKDNMRSLPKGMEGHQFKELHIVYPSLTEREKHLLRELGNNEAPF